MTSPPDRSEPVRLRLLLNDRRCAGASAATVRSLCRYVAALDTQQVRRDFVFWRQLAGECVCDLSNFLCCNVGFLEQNSTPILIIIRMSTLILTLTLDSDFCILYSVYS